MNSAQAPAKARDHFPNFDLLRLFLALEVVFFHLWGKTHNEANSFLIFDPVPSFVAISGYMILGSLNNSRSGWHFWQKRALRILPAFVTSLILVLVLFNWQEVVHCLQTYISFNWKTPSANGPLWSLSCEEVLYLTLFGLAALKLVTPRSLYIILGLALAARFVVPWMEGHRNQDTAALYAAWGSLCVAFSMGVLAKLLNIRAATWTFAGIFVGLALVQGIMRYNLPITHTDWLWVILGAVAVLSLGVAKPLPWTPKIDLSYGIYIYHSPIILKLYEEGLQGWTLVFVSVPLTFLVAALSYKFIEMPALKLKNKGFSKQTQPAPAAQTAAQ